jgi:hypothetical protein
MLTFLVTYTIIIVGGIVGNVLVVVVILVNKTMRSVTNVLLVSLAASDTLIASWNVPIQLVYYTKNEWTMGEWFGDIGDEFPECFWTHIGIVTHFL